ncbi:MAG: hypothetical protein IJU57_03420 [Clostridia bacterium]|nr:hypothetical protein [Clostridia bacterium]
MAQIHAHFYLNSIGRAGGAELIVPQKYYDSPAERQHVPVLYLLHGAGGDETSFIRFTSIETYAEKYGLAVVMPGGELSDFTDMTHGFRYYTYVTDELPSLMYSVFGLSPSREKCLIAGCSMGANAAVRIALSRPERYGACGCLSGGLSFRLPPLETEGLDPEKDRYAFMRYDRRQIRGSEEDVTGNAKKIAEEGGPAPRIYHAVGTGDKMLEHARRTRDFFTSFENDPFCYTYSESEGGHDWLFWDRTLPEFLDFALGDLK